MLIKMLIRLLRVDHADTRHRWLELGSASDYYITQLSVEYYSTKGGPQSGAQVGFRIRKIKNWPTSGSDFGCLFSPPDPFERLIATFTGGPSSSEIPSAYWKDHFYWRQS